MVFLRNCACILIQWFWTQMLTGFPAFLRSYGRLQSCRHIIWWITIIDSMQSYSWHEVYICCIMPAIWYPETVWRCSCPGYSETHDNVSTDSRIKLCRDYYYKFSFQSFHWDIISSLLEFILNSWMSSNYFLWRVSTGIIYCEVLHTENGLWYVVKQ
jgi:hypothetical protein